MLQLGTGMKTVEGVTVFPDHADENQYWYLPAHLEIARRQPDNWPQFSFIKYKRAATAGGVEGGGFLMFTVALTLPEAVERKIRAEIPANANLTAVPFDSGTVECVALNLQGPGGTTATVSEAGTFIAVQEILGARTPSLFGENHAVFSLTLSAEGATLLESAFAQGAAPIGVIYTMTFTAMQPSLDVKITADFERIYQHFSAGLNANLYYVEVAIQAGIEELVQTGAIKIEVTNYSTAADKQDQEKMAIDFFMEHLLQAWFTPTLTPGALQGGMASAPKATGTSLFGKDDEKKKTDGDTPARPGGGGSGGGGAQPPAPPPPPPPGGGGNPPAPPAPPGGGGGNPPSPPTPPGGGGRNPGEPAVPSINPGGTTPTPPGTREYVARFVEGDTGREVPGLYTVGYLVGEEYVDTSPAESTARVRMTLPANWAGGIAANIRALPELAIADADEIRRHATTGEQVVASGQRPGDLGITFVEFPNPGPGPLATDFQIPVRKTIVSASSPDALVAAIFPGGQLLQRGVYDCRRVTGTNTYELIALDTSNGFISAPGGAS
ncbi:MAG: hypothetical protein IPJ61_05020 [Tessaracoccus sp.]|uniref:hypothetical protein n=1 Tax=Tessaracoccus sp. TaxID=1971211 RepID=UPI001EB4BEE3|nr:hypothetical protein [Tessaracoccus sp.]MBK7820437.1 hypothetical protein [Tessaracoccus sp.]